MTNNTIFRNFIGYSAALLLGAVAAGIESFREIPEFGVSPHFWGVITIAAVTFMGFGPGIVTAAVAGLLIALQDGGSTFNAGAVLLYMAETAFIGWQLQRHKTLDVLAAALKFWIFIGLPALAIYHWPLFELSLSAGMLLLGNELTSRLVCAALVQWICLNPALVSRLDILCLGLKSRCQWSLERLVYILFPVFAILPALVAIQVDNVSMTKDRMASLHAAADVAISDAQQALAIDLLEVRNRVLEDLNSEALSQEFLLHIVAREPAVCAAFITLNQQLEVDQCAVPDAVRAQHNWRDHEHEQRTLILTRAYPDIPHIALMHAGPTDLAIDLRVMAKTLNDSSVPVASRLRAIDLYVASDLNNLERQVTLTGSNLNAARSRLEKSIRQVMIIDSPILLKMTGNDPSIGLRMSASTRIRDQVGEDLKDLALELLAALTVLTTTFVLFILWLRRTLPQVTQFVAASHEWQPGQSLILNDSEQSFVIRELETAQTSLVGLVENFNNTYNRLEHTDRALQHSASQLRSVFASVRSPLLVLDEHLNIVMCNSAYERIQDAVKSHLADAQRRLHQAPEKRSDAEFSDAIVNAILDGKSSQDIELALDNGDTPWHFVASVGPLQGWYEMENESGCIVALSDITMIVQTRNQLVHTAKLASIGELASGMAHELNQPLNVIRMSCHNLMRSLSKGTFTETMAQEKLERINAQVDRAAKIIAGMKAFGRKANMTSGPINPSMAINTALDLLREQLATQTIIIDYQPLTEPVTIFADAMAIEQIIINLVTNARDAIKEKEVNPGRIWIRESLIKGKFHVEVEDNGGGIPSKALKSVFDPFFTTKEVGKGTGLGLSISYGILQEIGGELEVENTDKGACFNFEVPTMKTIT